jgi:hypothetical protein
VRDWWTAVLSLLLGGGASGALVAARAGRGERRTDVARADAHAAQDALLVLRRAYRQHRGGHGLTEDELFDLEDAFDIAAQRTLSNGVVAAARDYLAIASRYATDDPDFGDNAERVAYDALTAALWAVLKKNR